MRQLEHDVRMDEQRELARLDTRVQTNTQKRFSFYCSEALA